MEEQDNPYIVTLDPEEFDELLGGYQTHVERCKKSMSRKQLAVAQRVLNSLYEADATHVCVDEVETTPTPQRKE